MNCNILIVLAVCVYSGYTKDLPSYIKPCSISAPDFDDCCLQHGKAATSNLLKGDKKYNVPNFIPLVIPSITLQNDGGFNLVLKDATFYGLEAISLNQVKFNIKEKNVMGKASIPLLTIIGKYEIDGKILILPIQGNGGINITAVDLDIQYEMKYDLEKNNGEDYIVPKDGKSDFTLTTAKFKLDNLFNGNKELGDSTNQLLNDEPLKFVDALKPVITETIVKVGNEIISAITSVVPYEKIFLK